ncbi:MAG: hypothetical protein DMF75_06210, partial [Acidobacteria bacterium]
KISPEPFASGSSALPIKVTTEDVVTLIETIDLLLSPLSLSSRRLISRNYSVDYDLSCEQDSLSVPSILRVPQWWNL